ncbi:helix-turn-helix transcriptional regulator [Xanthobacter sp. VNH20]|uniref:helix-turn-helix domain-containing protein n=1 Tax=Xanthobacter sp. VNH20 TaxID=3156616 RepID=UPI0032B61F3F
MANHEPAATAYLRFVLREMKISATELAKRSGISATTLTRPLNDPDHKFTLTTKTIGKIAEASGISPGPFFSAGDSITASLASIFDDRVFAKKRWGEQGDAPDLTLIVGEAEPGVWREPEIVEVTNYSPILLRSSQYESKDCFGLIMRGRSLERIAEDGDILFCVRSEATSRALMAGDVVIVERKSPDERLVEVSARVVGHGSDRPTLRFATTEQRFSTLAIPLPVDTDKSIKIIGEVLYVIRTVRER